MRETLQAAHDYLQEQIDELRSQLMVTQRAVVELQRKEAARRLAWLREQNRG